jgi:hypothetical protein
VVSNTVECFDTEIESQERHVRAPGGVIEAPLDEGIERTFAGVAAGTVSAVVTERDRLSESDV